MWCCSLGDKSKQLHPYQRDDDDITRELRLEYNDCLVNTQFASKLSLNPELVSHH